MKQRAYKELTSISYDNLLYVLSFPNAGSRGDKICFPNHYHDRMELLRIRHGKMTMYIDDSRFEAQAGNLVIINPNQSHTAIATTDRVHYDVISFELISLNNNSFAYQKYIDPLLNQRITFANVTSNANVLALADDLIRSYREKHIYHPLHKISLIYQILGAFFQHCPLIEHNPNKCANIDAITAYINEHFNEPLSVAEISAKFGYNANYFCRMFKNNTAMSVSQYIQSRRLERAKRMLRETEENVTAIAVHCGYADVSYFSNRFKLYTGKSPQQFRAYYNEET